MTETKTREEIRAAILAERNAAMDDLLIRWHAWQPGIRTSRGYSTTASGCRDYVTSRQYDSGNGALDDDIERRIMRGVQACAEKLGSPYREAIGIEARNLSTGLSVWQSPRIPEDKREEVRLEARRLMLAGLVGSGLVD